MKEREEREGGGPEVMGTMGEGKDRKGREGVEAAC